MAGTKQFTKVQDYHPDHNLFDFSHSVKGDFDFGYIYPVDVQQCVPGDVVRLGVQVASRLNPTVVPFSHQIDCNIYSFFVPYRILDFKQTPHLFESVISGGIDGTESRDFPRLTFKYSDGVSSAYGYYRNLYPLTTLLTESALTYYPSSSSSASTSFHFYPTSASDEDSYLEYSYVFPNPVGVRASDVVSDYDSAYIYAAFGIHSLSDYLGIIPPMSFGITKPYLQDGTLSLTNDYYCSQVLAYPWYAYNAIYINYFADENIESVIFKDPSGVQDDGDFFIHGNMLLMRGNWQKDYFSSALPFQQRGSAPAISVTPVSSWANLTVDPDDILYDSDSGSSPSASVTATLDPYSFSFVKKLASTSNASKSTMSTNASSSFVVYNDSDSETSATWTTTNSGDDVNAFVWGAPNVGVNLDGFNGSFDIATLRNSIALQHFMERNARSGIRYTEFLRSHFGTSPSDSRLQRPEYLGGTKTNVICEEVTQTSSSTEDSVLGDLAGKGFMASVDGHVVNSYHVEEFGLIMSVMVIRPKAGYCQGIPREWTYGDRYEWFFPEFQNLSEQEIQLQELYAFRYNASASSSDSDYSSVAPSARFGFQGIYDELRTTQDRVCGEFRNTLSYWHLARIFDDVPSLSYDFIKVMPYSDDLHRIFATEGTEQYPVSPFYMTLVFEESFLRPITFMPNPGVSYI